MCLYNTFPCVSHDAEALHRTLFEENNAGAAFQVFRCKWYYCANLNLKAGSKLLCDHPARDQEVADPRALTDIQSCVGERGHRPRLQELLGHGT